MVSGPAREALAHPFLLMDRGPSVVLGSHPTGCSPFCWGSYLDRSSPGGLECLLPLLPSPSRSGPFPSSGPAGSLPMVPCSPAHRSPSLPPASDAAGHLLCAGHGVGCFHKGCLISPSKQPFEGGVIVPISQMENSVKWCWAPAFCLLCRLRCETFQKETWNEGPSQGTVPDFAEHRGDGPNDTLSCPSHPVQVSVPLC